MYFRIIYEIQVRAERGIQDRHLIVSLPSFQVNAEDGTRVTFRKRTFEEAASHVYEYEDIVQACFEEALPEKYEEFFSFLHESAVYPDQNELSFRYQDSSGCIQPWPRVNSNLVPKGLMDEVYRIRTTHTARALDVIKFVRWRLNRSFSDKFIRSRGSEFSMNRVDWYPMPYANITAIPSPIQPISHHLAINHSQREDIKLSLLDSSEYMREPFYRYLFHEAWELYDHSPLSAITMAMVVVESAVKQCLIYHDHSRRESLDADESPSPYELIKEICSLRKEKNFIPKRTRTAIHQATEIRNKIVHTGKIPDINIPHFQRYREDPCRSAFELLILVKELMWLLEYGRDQSWAEDYIDKL